jgi:N-methylhydantoinase A
MLPGTTDFTLLQDRLEPLRLRARQELEAEGLAPEQTVLQAEVDLRYRGQSYELRVPWPANGGDLLASFHHEHQAAYGYQDLQAEVEIVNLRLRAAGTVPVPELKAAPMGESDPDKARLGDRQAVLRSGIGRLAVFDGLALRPGDTFGGPALVVLTDTTVFLEAEDRCRMDGFRNLILDVGASRHA